MKTVEFDAFRSMAVCKHHRFIENRRILKWIENGEVKKSVEEDRNKLLCFSDMLLFDLRSTCLLALNRFEAFHFSRIPVSSLGQCL